MDLIKEVNLLRYQFRPMQSMIQSDEFPFYRFIIDNEFKEELVNALRKILIAFHDRLTVRKFSLCSTSNVYSFIFKLNFSKCTRKCIVPHAHQANKTNCPKTKNVYFYLEMPIFSFWVFMF